MAAAVLAVRGGRFWPTVGPVATTTGAINNTKWSKSLQVLMHSLKQTMEAENPLLVVENVVFQEASQRPASHEAIGGRVHHLPMCGLSCSFVVWTKSTVDHLPTRCRSRGN